MNRKTLLTGFVGIAVVVAVFAMLWLRRNSEPQFATLSARDAEVIEFVLRNGANVPDDRIYFLTVTPMNEWGDHGSWRALPSDFHVKIADISLHYRPASEAYLSEGKVLQRQTNAEAWMQWVTIKRWISDTEVEVEEGIWCCPLGGGASTSVYEKQDGHWRLKSLGEMWMS